MTEGRGSASTDEAPPESLPFEERYGSAGPLSGRYAQARANPDRFWAEVAREELRWTTPFTRTLDWNPPFAKWFPDGTLNVSVNCLDRHREGPHRDRVAYFWEGEPGDRRTITYEELGREVEQFAAALRARGFGPEDRAAVYLPMVPELPITMLALARLGIAFTVVFSGFSSEALAHRIRDLGVSLVVTADGGYRRGQIVPLKAIADEALATAAGVRTVVVVRRTGESVPMHAPRDVSWTELVEGVPETCPPPAFPSDHLLFLLYSSGTTGAPKAIAHGTGGYLTHVTATMRWVFDPRPSDVFWCAADIGWVTGHSYIVFAPLSLGVTSVLYEGAFDTPRPDRFWEIVERYRVTILHTSPTALRSLRRAGDDGVARHDLSSLRLLGTVGESINPAVWRWYHTVVGRERCPIVDTWWQTETGGMLITPAPGLQSMVLKPGSATLPLPGIDAAVVTESGAFAGPGERGYAVICRPWPGMMLGLYRDEARYRSTYWSRFPGCYYAGDFALRDSDGYFWFLGRADEVLKVAGHRIGTIEVEDALLTHPAVAEAAVVGVPDPVKGEVPLAFVVIRPGVGELVDLPGKLRSHVAEQIGKFAQPRDVHLVGKLPRTRSGKIMRRLVKAVALHGADVGDVTTLEDQASVEEIRQAVASFSRELGRP
jgi:acetyl-CoA synthetase